MHVIGMSLFRRGAIKSSVCKLYKEMSIKARITRNNKWLFRDAVERNSRFCFANIIRKKKIVCIYREFIYTVSNLTTRIDGFSFCLQILHSLYKRSLTRIKLHNDKSINSRAESKIARLLIEEFNKILNLFLITYKEINL